MFRRDGDGDGDGDGVLMVMAMVMVVVLLRYCWGEVPYKYNHKTRSADAGDDSYDPSQPAHVTMVFIIATHYLG